MHVLYEDNHLIAIYKEIGQIVQGDSTGDTPLSEAVANYLAKKYNKPGKAFIGVIHRIDRPVEGIVIFAKTSKALSRMNNLFRENGIHKRYLAIVTQPPFSKEAELRDFIYRNTKINKTFVVKETTPKSKEAILQYKTVAHSEYYTLLSIKLITGRHHQIRCQLANQGSPIRGDLKYGAPRSNKDGGISLLAYEVFFVHPISKQLIILRTPLPKNSLWQAFAHQVQEFDERVYNKEYIANATR